MSNRQSACRDEFGLLAKKLGKRERLCKAWLIIAIVNGALFVGK